MQRITVEEAGNQLNMTPLTIRILMQQKELPIGYAYKREGCSNYHYVIYKELVDGYIQRVENGRL